MTGKEGVRGWIVKGRFPRELLAANQRGRNQTHKHTAALEAAGINTVRATANSKGRTHNGTTGGLSDASEASVRLAFRVFVMRVSQTHARLSDASEASVRLASRATALSSEWQNMISALGAVERKRKQENNQNNQIYK